MGPWRKDEETKLAALSAGASDFLTKPFSTTELHVRIKNLVESHQYQRKVSKQNQVLETTIEQLKDTETQLVQTEKLASLGRMSAGIIHEINNPLNFATTGLYTLRNKGKFLAAEQQADYQEVLKDVEDGMKRVKNIVSDLRMFTHPDTESRDQVEISEVVTASLRFLSNEWRDKVQIEQHLLERSINVPRLQILAATLQQKLGGSAHQLFDQRGARTGRSANDEFHYFRRQPQPTGIKTGQPSSAVLVGQREEIVPEALDQAVHQAYAGDEPGQTVAAQQCLGDPGGDLQILAVAGDRLNAEVANGAPLRRRSGRRVVGLHGSFGGARLGARVAQAEVAR